MATPLGDQGKRSLTLLSWGAPLSILKFFENTPFKACRFIYFILIWHFQSADFESRKKGAC